MDSTLNSIIWVCSIVQEHEVKLAKDFITLLILETYTNALIMTFRLCKKAICNPMLELWLKSYKYRIASIEMLSMILG